MTSKASPLAWMRLTTVLALSACSANLPSNDAVSQCVLDTNRTVPQAGLGSQFICNEYYPFENVSVGASKATADTATYMAKASGYFVKDISSQAMSAPSCYVAMSGNGFFGETISAESKFSVDLEVMFTKWSDGWRCTSIKQTGYATVAISAPATQVPDPKPAPAADAPAGMTSEVQSGEDATARQLSAAEVLLALAAYPIGPDSIGGIRIGDPLSRINYILGIPNGSDEHVRDDLHTSVYKLGNVSLYVYSSETSKKVTGLRIVTLGQWYENKNWRNVIAAERKSRGGLPRINGNVTLWSTASEVRESLGPPDVVYEGGCGLESGDDFQYQYPGFEVRICDVVVDIAVGDW